MIPAVEPPPDSPTLTDFRAEASVSQSLAVAEVGEVGEDLRVALAANGLSATSCPEVGEGTSAAAIYAPGLSPEQLRELARTGLPLLSDTDPSDMRRIAALVRAGVDDVVPRPVRAEELARKLWRALRKHRRHKGRSQ